MKKLFFSAFALSVILFSTNLTAQDNNQAEMMAAWQKAMTPGPMHQMMADGVGTWTADISMWMDPSQPPTKSTGTSVTESIMGGRYFQTKHSGLMMGMPFEGMEISGYDNIRKLFFSTWIDNMGTGVMNLEGTLDEANKVLTLNGVSWDPMTGKEIKVRESIKFIDKDKFVFEMFMNQAGQETKSMEITFTRAK